MVVLSIKESGILFLDDLYANDLLTCDSILYTIQNAQ